MTDVNQERTFKGWVRPLSLSSLRISPHDKVAERVHADLLLRDLCNDWTQEAVEGIKARFLQVDAPDLEIFVVPAENMVLEKLVWPLRHAKGAFCMQNFLGCIAICGMVCEMATVFIYDLAADAWDLSKLHTEDQKLFSNRRYEKLGQQDRIRGLVRMHAIPKTLGDLLDRVRQVRRGYLHFLQKDYSRIEDDASESYKATCRVVIRLVGIPLGDKGEFQIPSHLERYLQSRDVIERNNP